MLIFKRYPSLLFSSIQDFVLVQSYLSPIPCLSFSRVCCNSLFAFSPSAKPPPCQANKPPKRFAMAKHRRRWHSPAEYLLIVFPLAACSSSCSPPNELVASYQSFLPAIRSRKRPANADGQAHIHLLCHHHASFLLLTPWLPLSILFCLATTPRLKLDGPSRLTVLSVTVSPLRRLSLFS